ncbi:MAG: hypothetical protein JSV04_13905 [Candidatus Heimdallarchaeota archaeon]|nr:MAG: hypothetical protein JSV04_13905 [Candidatus Heimdallarchaeota archaeon]
MADDVFVLQTSGIPLFAKCYGGDYCKLHPDHALQTGFLAAMYSFAEESFGQEELKSVVFQDIRLDFKIDKEKEIIMVFANPLGTEKVEERLNQAMDIFLKKYGSKLGLIAQEGTFDEFENDLLNLNIVRSKAMGDIKPMKSEMSLWKRFVNKLRRK